MRKILFGLFIAISYMANAALPVVNDSVLVEAKEDDAYYDMFLKSLPDSVYDSPMVTRFFREVGGLGNIKISLIEHYSLNGKNKNHYLKFDISDAISSIGILMSYDDVKSIITILTDIYENTKELRLSGEKENISYKKLISSRSLFSVSLSYNPKKDRWNCQIDISIVDPTNYVGKSVIIYQDVDYKKHCRLKDFEKDMPKLIELLKQGLVEITDRKYNYKEPKLVSNNDGSRVKYLKDYGYGLWDKYADVNPNPNYVNQLVKERYTIDLNFKINGIIDNKYKKLKKLDTFGVVEVVIDESGQVVCSKLSLNKAVSDALDEKTIVKILANIDGYKFKKIEDGTDYVKVYIPLKGYPQY